MPCPYFEPQEVVDGQRTGGRLPLFDEYNGHCHVNGEVQPVWPAARFVGCNQGNPHSGCVRFPTDESPRTRRFHIQGKSHANGPVLDILVLTVENHIPVFSHSIRYFQTLESLDPDVFNPCERAQILAFCRSYFKRFPYSVMS